MIKQFNNRCCLNYLGAAFGFGCSAFVRGLLNTEDNDGRDHGFGFGVDGIGVDVIGVDVIGVDGIGFDGFGVNGAGIFPDGSHVGSGSSNVSNPSVYEAKRSEIKRIVINNIIAMILSRVNNIFCIIQFNKTKNIYKDMTDDIFIYRRHVS